ncbi:unnamed protein product, partial [Prorocentrum cordatum]
SRRDFFTARGGLGRRPLCVPLPAWPSAHIAFTGAGISTGAGVADFRSGTNTVLPTGPGLWERPKDDAAPPPGAPRGGILEQCARARPGRTHGVVQRLWEAGRLRHVISQNVDGLHRIVRHPTASPLGAPRQHPEERCTRCGHEYERDFNVICSGGLTGRHCEQRGCAHPLRHSGVGFGQDLPEEVVERAWAESERADLCLALGSSITVTPASEMPAWVAKRHRGRQDKGLVIVNLQATPCDEAAALRINGLVDDVMERVEQLLLQRGCSPGGVAALTAQTPSRGDAGHDWRVPTILATAAL